MGAWPWTPHQLLALVWVLRVIPEAGDLEDVVRRSWLNLPIGGRFDLSELEMALSNAISFGLVARQEHSLVALPGAIAASQVGEIEAARLLYLMLLESETPLWILSSLGGDGLISAAMVPDEQDLVLRYLFSDPEAREAFLLALARKFDQNRLQDLGLRGEQLVVRLCKSELEVAGRLDLVDQVRHVSIISDQLGYDVSAPFVDGQSRHLEVKATTRSGPSVHIFISRNEFRTALSDPSWYLVVVRITTTEELLGWIDVHSLIPAAPMDSSSGEPFKGTWESARITLEVEQLRAGLPIPTLSAMRRF